MLIKCNNQAMVAVLNSGKARDAYLGVCAHNVWCMAKNYSVYMFLGTNNRAVDLLSRWVYSLHNIQELQAPFGNPVWMPVDVNIYGIG